MGISSRLALILLLELSVVDNGAGSKDNGVSDDDLTLIEYFFLYKTLCQMLYLDYCI